MSTAGIIAHLSTASPIPQISFLAGRPQADWELIYAHAELMELTSGLMIAEAGVADRALYLLAHGIIAAYNPGESAPFKQIRAQSILGEVSFVDGGPRSATLVTYGPCKLMRIDYTAYDAITAANPDLGRAIMTDLAKLLAVRLRMAGKT